MSHASCCDDPNFRPLGGRHTRIPLPTHFRWVGAVGRGIGQAVLRRHRLMQWRGRLLDSAVGARPNE